MIEIENLTRKFGDLTAVDNLTLHVDKGEVFGFLGLTEQERPPLSGCSVALYQRQAAKRGSAITKLVAKKML